MNKQKKFTSELSKIKKELPFEVPENYFDDFPVRLQNKLEMEKRVLPQSGNRIIKYLKPALALAASFALIFLLTYWPIKSFLPSYFADTTIQIDTLDEEDSFLSIIERTDESSFFAFLLESLSIEDNSTEDNFNDDELLTYLSANVSDYEIYLQSEN